MDFAPKHLVSGVFLERPNRFLVRCRIEGARVVDAQMPNSGRLAELLLPGATLRLADEAPPALMSPGAPSRPTQRKTRYTAWAVEREGETVFLHTQQTNVVARRLLERGMIPGLEAARVVRSEAVCGSSRFDFLMEEERGRFFLEVKSVTLFGNGAALFPDAVTERGRRHLLELAELASEAERLGEPRPVVLFLVHSDRVDRFLPDYHTDLEFSRTFLAVRDRVRLVPVALGWTPSLQIRGPVRPLTIPWDFLEQEVEDRGSYLLLMRLEEGRSISVGRLETIDFEPGWYVYVGSAMKNLTSRIDRHLRRRKRLHWHVDYLRQSASECRALPIRSSRRDECALAKALGSILRPSATGFGSSDCDCPTHLFHCTLSPLNIPDFHRMLEAFRMPGEARPVQAPRR
ncbi:MAG: DNA/RNA nuclease SfsA [Acidobacteriota bacterium]